MRAKLTLLRPSIGKVIRRGYAEYPTAVLTREQFREVVRSIESMMQETDVLTPEEQDRLAKVFTNLEVTVPLYETEAFEVSSAENVLMWIDEARNTMDQHGILHAPIGAPWRK